MKKLTIFEQKYFVLLFEWRTFYFEKYKKVLRWVKICWKYLKLWSILNLTDSFDCAIFPNVSIDRRENNEALPSNEVNINRPKESKKKTRNCTSEHSLLSVWQLFIFEKIKWSSKKKKKTHFTLMQLKSVKSFLML